eukprot:TRINITY_DN25627_c0_g1_i1.p1 TRINITY_DN25627_c0_g1~~TRINITY_DN25627_c0_g1_i1.p1  ORF type:complete len:333 (+),score=62.83 TRINITY_DN25627_c0_g1_i1:75-1001(+)
MAVAWADHLLRNDALRHEASDREFLEADVDRNGSLSLQEAMDLVFNICATKGLRTPHADQVEKLATMADRSGDGRLQRVEFRAVFTTVLKACVNEARREASALSTLKASLESQEKTAEAERSLPAQPQLSWLDSLRSRASDAATSAADAARQNARAVGNATKTLIQDGKFQATAAGAATGATAAGTGGAVAGLAMGSMLGAAAGVVPAVFTLGLSIPVGAAIGGGTGLAAGTAVGSTTGAITGGAVGYCVHSRRDEIRSGAQQTWAKVSEGVDMVRRRATDSAGYVKSQASAVRARISSGGSTGGTDS